MKISLSSLLFAVLLSLSACRSNRAKSFKTSIDSCEQTALHCLVGGDSLTHRKDQLILKRDFKGALSIARSQDSIYKRMLHKLHSLSTNSIKNGAELKNAAINYYEPIGALITINNSELEWQLQNVQSRPLKQRTDDFLELSDRGLKLDKAIITKRVLFDQAIRRFNEVNGIQ